MRVYHNGFHIVSGTGAPLIQSPDYAIYSRNNKQYHRITPGTILLPEKGYWLHVTSNMVEVDFGIPSNDIISAFHSDKKNNSYICSSIMENLDCDFHTGSDRLPQLFDYDGSILLINGQKCFKINSDTNESVRLFSDEIHNFKKISGTLKHPFIMTNELIMFIKTSGETYELFKKVGGYDTLKHESFIATTVTNIESNSPVEYGIASFLMTKRIETGVSSERLDKLIMETIWFKIDSPEEATYKSKEITEGQYLQYHNWGTSLSKYRSNTLLSIASTKMYGAGIESLFTTTFKHRKNQDPLVKQVVIAMSDLDDSDTPPYVISKLKGNFVGMFESGGIPLTITDNEVIEYYDTTTPQEALECRISTELKTLHPHSILIQNKEVSDTSERNPTIESHIVGRSMNGYQQLYPFSFPFISFHTRKFIYHEKIHTMGESFICRVPVRNNYTIPDFSTNTFNQLPGDPDSHASMCEWNSELNTFIPLTCCDSFYRVMSCIQLSNGNIIFIARDNDSEDKGYIRIISTI